MTDKPIPAWAVKAVLDFADGVGTVVNDPAPLARLLVATREAALREAAKVSRRMEPRISGNICVCEQHIAHAILSLIDKEPAS